jgi:8-oxo-dGTP pyrophosphatase MutT (NUDIX family)
VKIKKKMSNKESEVLENSLVYDGYHKIEEVIRNQDGEELKAEVLKKGKTVSAVIYNTESKKYIFIEQYKVAADGVTVEVINGSVDEDEKPQQSIKRLVTELTGYKVELVKEITNYYTDTNNSDEICSLYYVEVNEKVIDDLEFNDYKLVEIEKLGLGGKLFVQDPINMMNFNTEENKKMIPPYQSLDAKSLIAVMWVENNNILKDVAELITNAKIRSL